MRCTRSYLKVLWPVVVLIFIYVMDNLMRPQDASKPLLCYKSMLKNIPRAPRVWMLGAINCDVTAALNSSSPVGGVW